MVNADLSRLSMNQATMKHADFKECVDVIARLGYGAIGAWRDRIQEIGADKAAKIARDAGIQVSSLCRGGFFTTMDPDRCSEALEDNRMAIVEAETLGTHELVMVVGGLPACPSPGEPVRKDATDIDRDIVATRERIADRLADLVPFATEHGVRLLIEPMHPMFTADRGCVATIHEALDLAHPFSSQEVGVVVDTYHVWWDPQLRSAIERAGRENRIGSYQVCDWVLPLRENVLNSRGYVGDGYIDFATVTRWVADAGYTGDIETEIFNDQIWGQPSQAIAETVAQGYRDKILPYF